MNPLALTALLAFIGTVLAYAAGVWGGFYGGILLIGAAIFILTAGYMVGSEAYDKGIKDAEGEDVYNDS